jgi:hypothetical protein
MLSRHIAAELESIAQKILPCNFDQGFTCVQSKYRAPGLAALRCFQKGCQ